MKRGKGQFKVLEVERPTQMGDILNKSSYGKMVLNLIGKTFVKSKSLRFYLYP